MSRKRPLNVGGGGGGGAVAAGEKEQGQEQEQEEVRFVMPGVTDAECRLLATNLPQSVSADEIEGAFSRCGLLHTVHINPEERYAIVVFHLQSEARRALRKLQGHKLQKTMPLQRKEK